MLIDQLNDNPQIAMNIASTTHATGERKNDRSSLVSRMKNVRMPVQGSRRAFP
jgi:hypothetical protein